MSFNPFSATWTKFLHSESNLSSTRDAILSLLRESERELTKLFCANGNTVPFQEQMIQSLTLRRGQRRDSSAGSSLQSEFVLIATPRSTVSDDTVPKVHLNEETPVEEVTAQAAVTAEELVSERQLPEEPAALCDAPEPVSQKPEEVHSGWGNWGISKEDKKAREIDAGWGNWGTSKETQESDIYVDDGPHVVEEPSGKDNFSADFIIEEAPVSESQIDLPLRADFGWGCFSFKNDKEEGKESEQVLLEVIEEPAAEDVRAAEPEVIMSKKDKKKKRKSSKIIEELIFEDKPVLSKKDEKKDGEIANIFEEPIFENEPLMGKKDKKKKGKIEIIEEPAAEAEIFKTKKSKKKKGNISVQIEDSKVDEAPPLPSDTQLAIK